MDPSSQSSGQASAAPVTPLRHLREAAPEVSSPKPTEFADPHLFINRELSWLEFNYRVLEEARDATLPLYERLKFMAIFTSNLDEFFMVRVAGLKQQIAGGVAEAPADGLLPAEQLAAVGARAREMIAERDRLWEEEILPALTEHKIFLLKPEAFNPEQRAAARAHFTAQVFPALTPLAVDPGHPFPHLRNKSLNIAVMLRQQGWRRRKDPHGNLLAVVQVPSVLGRLVPLPSATGRAFVLLEESIAAHVGDLFPGYTVQRTATFRVTRNWDLLVDDEESEDLLSTIQDELRRRDRGAAVRLELEAAAPKELEGALIEALNLDPLDVYQVRVPLQIPDLMALTDADPRPELRVESISPSTPSLLKDVDSIFAVVAKGDVLLHHPYQPFDPVVRFVEEAAEDPNVLAIKQTLYRTSGDSPFVRALSRAAENGKQVTAIVEIKARFDEANNIAWAHRLEENGVHVVYGVIGLKTHCKVALVVRREGNGIRRYVHLGTGNYNPQTARQYTDLSLFTVREEIADDVTALFNMLTGYSEPPQWKRLAVSPLDLQGRILQLIGRETELARQGKPARIAAKMNSLVDPVIIRALYAASTAGVEIDLLIRGICCLRPGVPGVSDHIRVTSIVDRFLEHSRILVFGTGDRAEVYLSSADWMPRNLYRRIEVLYPVEAPALRGRILEEIMQAELKDNMKARRLLSDGTYVRVEAGDAPLRSQQAMVEAARRASEPTKLEQPLRKTATIEPPTRN